MLFDKARNNRPGFLATQLASISDVQEIKTTQFTDNTRLVLGEIFRQFRVLQQVSMMGLLSPTVHLVNSLGEFIVITTFWGGKSVGILLALNGHVLDILPFLKFIRVPYKEQQLSNAPVI